MDILRRRQRFQKGGMYERSGFIYVRYYRTEAGRRTQVSERLCSTDTRPKERKLQFQQFMLKVNNSQNGAGSEAEDHKTTVGEFWSTVYLPFIEQNKRASTVDGYKQIWRRHLEPHIGAQAIRDFKTPDAIRFLDGVAAKVGKNTFAHVKNLASGIFSHAVGDGLIPANPWREAKPRVTPRRSVNTPHYTLEEAENIISALVERVDCQLVVALAFFLGLRPGEIAGLQWGDVDPEALHIRRAVVRGLVGETKTPESVASLPLIEPVKTLLGLWRPKCPASNQGWMFPNSQDRPTDLRELARRVIIPILQKNNLTWKGLYAGRRGAGTVLTALTGDALAAQQILRHKNLAVTTGFYVKKIPEAGLAGMKLLEAVANGKNGGK